MKNKFFSILLICLVCISLCACQTQQSSETNSSEQISATEENSVEEQTESIPSEESVIDTEALVEELGIEETSEAEAAPESDLLSIVGVFYGDVYANQSGSFYSDMNLSGFKDCIVVFDYTNDSTNRSMPKSTCDPKVINTFGITNNAITLTLNDTNTYESMDPNADHSHYINAINRYTDYKYPIGYGNLLGGADPVRMFAVFYVNPNELTSGTNAVLTVDDQVISFTFDNPQKITYADEILKCEDDYEAAQQAAAFKWRMDKLAELSGDVDHFLATMDPGSDLSGVGDSIGNLFSTDYGVTITGLLKAGFDPNHTYDGMNTDLPHFDVDTLTRTLPDQADDINALIDAANELGSAVQDSSYDSSDVRDILQVIVEHYANLVTAFGIDVYER